MTAHSSAAMPVQVPAHFGAAPAAIAESGQGFSLLPALAGAEFSCRSSYVLISERWLHAGTEAGVFAGFAISVALVIAASVAAIGESGFPLRRISKAPALRSVLVYLSFAGLSLFWTGAASPASSAFYWLNLVSDVLVVALLSRAWGIERAAHSLIKGFVAGTIALAALAWLMPAAEDLRLGDLDYFNTNQIGNLCALSLFMCFLLASRGHGHWLWASLFLGVTLCRSLSKSTLVAFAASQSYRLMRDKGMSRRTKCLLIFAAVVVCLLCLGLWEAYYGIYTTAGNQAETLTGRTAIWAWTLNAALIHPWFGNGFDAMWKVAPPFGADMFEARHAENELLQQFFAYGACGLALLCAVYGSLYRQIRSIARDSERNLLTSLLIFALVRGLAEAEPFDLLLPLWLIAALALQLQSQTLSAQPRLSIGKA